jgi:hypothetical protein
VLDRLWWFVTGAVLGGVVAIRSVRRRPAPADLGSAAAQTGADLLGLAARLVRPPKR